MKLVFFTHLLISSYDYKSEIFFLCPAPPDKNNRIIQMEEKENWGSKR